ncbi:T9SS type A sorting domain-containing protein [Flavobacterium sp.]
MNKLYFLCLLFFQTGFSQAPAIQWQRALGGTNWDEVNCINQTTDGGYILAGSSRSNNGDVTGNHGDFDCWVVKLSASGNLEWQKALGGTSIDKATMIKESPDGGYIMSGVTSSSNGDVSVFHGIGQDFWIVKLSGSGNIVWEKTYGGSGSEYAQCVEVTSDGGYIAAGFTNSHDGDVSGVHGTQYPDGWIVKISGSGELQWQKAYGGTNYEDIYDIQQTLDGGYIIAATSASSDGDLSINYGGYDWWIVKLSGTGTIQWQKTFGSMVGEIPGSVRQTADGGYILAGVGGLLTNGEPWIVKLSSSGSTQWTASYGGSRGDNISRIRQTADGGYIAIGITNSIDGDVTGLHGDYNDAWMVKISNSGALQWQKTLGGYSNENGLVDIQQTTDGGYILTANTESSGGDVTGYHGGFAYDYWVVKLGPDLSNPVFENQSLQLFPNPAIATITVKQPNATIQKVSVTDIAGKIVLDELHDGNQINVEKLATGMYMLTAFSGDGKIMAKFVKQ